MNQKNKDMTHNKLYIVCPFSQMETFITHEICSDAYFLTGMAGRLCLDDDENTGIIRFFIEKENIRGLFVVNDLNCRFINEVLTNSAKHAVPATDTLKKLFSDFREVFPSEKPLERKKHLLAKLNINDHIRELRSNKVLKTLFLNDNVKIRGLITDKMSNYSEAVKL